MTAEDEALRLRPAERAEMAAEAERLGFDSLLAYLRHLHQSALARQPQDAPAPSPEPTRLLHATKLGEMRHGDALAHLHREAEPQSVDLIMTSPPFGLVRRKAYGNVDAHQYCDWFRPFAEGFRRVLKPSGSLVIDIGGAWNPGEPTRSLYHYELLIMLCREYGLHLCQEHYWWNPSKLPTPAEWVNVRRIRVKDAVNCLWWLSPTPWPKAGNRRVLAPYSASMRTLLKQGYRSQKRPSGHHISAHFSKDNGGAVPPNLLAAANTESNGRYQAHCREQGLAAHPARFPYALPEYFIRMLTDAGDAVLDPFAGSCVTGEAAERLGRRWVCCELREEYLRGALGRFPVEASSNEELALGTGPPMPRSRKPCYELHAPCGLAALDGAEPPLPQDGGRCRPS